MANQYDSIIIGAGIGGLVCGCYLAQSGLRVLIVEQQLKPGGYCSSFTKNGFLFDVGVHYLGSIKNGILGQVLNELNLGNSIKFNRFDPTDNILVASNQIFIHKNAYETVNEFLKCFPRHSKKIVEFFDFILSSDAATLYYKLRNFTFAEFLSIYFDDLSLKSALSVLLSNIGMLSVQVSAFTAAMLYKEYIFDPGYYPEGGMQSFADLLANRFLQLGGRILYGNAAEKINLTNRSVASVSVGQNVYNSRIVVSNIDAFHTFNVLLDAPSDESNKLERLETAPSIFAIYAGLRLDLSTVLDTPAGIWYFPSHNLEKHLFLSEADVLSKHLPGILISSPSLHDPGRNKDRKKSSIGIFSIAPYISERFWLLNKDAMKNKVIKATKNVLPFFTEENIEVENIATPLTFRRYTRNQNGSAFGWASTVSQLDQRVLPQVTSIDGLFLVGHWCTTGAGQGGVPKVAYSGRRVSGLILKDIKSRKK